MSEDLGRASESAGGRARPPIRRRGLRPGGRPWDVIGVVALGGAIGALARYGMGVTLPARVDSFPWETLLVNTVGCALIGVLMVLATEVWPARRLLRPFAGAGLLGGFTTFSAYALEIERLVAVGETGTALLYLAVTPVAAVAAVWLTAALTRGALRWTVAR
jgi:fluoride exporter